WIERSVELVSLLNIERPRLVISHESGDEGDMYQQRIKEYADRLGVELIFIGERIGPIRMFGARSDREYSIDDAYQAADIVTYPSGYEGFGNAFLEAIYFKKPIVVNRYSIFVEDIEPYGFDVIKFEAFITKEVVAQLMDFLRPGRLISSVEKNYEIARRYFSYEVLEKRLLSIINSFEGI
ncbi:MAG: glycosyltransferase family 1 protein, partial [Deltaproteobacteria bacterium]